MSCSRFCVVWDTTHFRWGLTDADKWLIDSRVTVKSHLLIISSTGFLDWYRIRQRTTVVLSPLVWWERRVCGMWCLVLFAEICLLASNCLAPSIRSILIQIQLLPRAQSCPCHVYLRLYEGMTLLVWPVLGRSLELVRVVKVKVTISFCLRGNEVFALAYNFRYI